ncbi:hypothetical protein GE09DRAFT_1059197 [Coniochaeta sp. 2T2.1]|nr:hypothetical protein GE09DRAFT_1059197 [Coniochaeta sp. 2T2.1]
MHTMLTFFLPIFSATAQEHISAPSPPKATEESTGVKPTEDKPAPEAALTPDKVNDPVTTTAPVGTTSADNKQEDIATKASTSTATSTDKASIDPVKAADPATAAAPPAGTASIDPAAAAAKEDDSAPKADPLPTMTGALGGNSDSAPPVEGVAQDSKPLTEEATNGAEKPDTEMTEDPAAAVGPAEPATGEKRKAPEDDEAVPTNGDAKKVKAADSDANGTGTNGANQAEGGPKKPGRPAGKGKKNVVEKTKEVVGRTLRKTRSQGPIDQ